MKGFKEVDRFSHDSLGGSASDQTRIPRTASDKKEIGGELPGTT
jgi:hypothetical protein